MIGKRRVRRLSRSAVDARQADVEHDHIGHRFAEALLRLDHMVGGDDLEPLQLEDEPQHLAEPTIVVDDQDAKRLIRHQVFPLRLAEPT